LKKGDAHGAFITGARAKSRSGLHRAAILVYANDSADESHAATRQFRCWQNDGFASIRRTLLRTGEGQRRAMPLSASKKSFNFSIA
jgi:hypothetical protein